MFKRNTNYNTKKAPLHKFGWVMWIGTVVCLILYSLMAMQPNPDVVRKEGILHEGTVVEKTQMRKFDGGNKKESPIVKVKLEDNREVGDLVSWDVMEKLHIGQKVKIWEYEGYFKVDEYDSLDYQNPYSYLVGSLAFLFLALLVHWKVRQKTALQGCR